LAKNVGVGLGVMQKFGWGAVGGGVGDLIKEKREKLGHLPKQQAKQKRSAPAHVSKAQYARVIGVLESALFSLCSCRRRLVGLA
jgi:hypothetical protein